VALTRSVSIPFHSIQFCRSAVYCIQYIASSTLEVWNVQLASIESFVVMNQLPFTNEIVNQMLVGTIPIACPALDESNRIQRDSVDEIVNLVKLYAMFHGFPLSHDPQRMGGAGKLYCGFAEYKKKSSKADASAGVLDARINGSLHVVSAPVNAACNWFVRYNVRRDGKVNLTKRSLKHSNHSCIPNVPGQGRVVDRMNQVTEIEHSMLEKLLKNRNNKRSALQSTMQDIYSVEYSDNLFQSMLRRARFNTKIPDGQEFVKLLSMLYERHMLYGDYYNYTIDEDGVTDSVVFLSHDMIWNFQRNAQAIAMDTTMKTNRFGLPMCLVCGVNEHGHTMIVAVALTSRQTAAAFSWILLNIRRAVGDQAWAQVRSIITDGDKAMKKAIESELPGAVALRCVFHVKLNIQSNTAKQIGEKSEQFIEQWTSIVNQSMTEEQFVHAKEKLTSDFPEANDYMKDNIWPNEKQFAYCFTRKVTTLGMRSTQRVEGKNAKLKGPLGLDSSTDVVTTIEKLITCVTEEEQRKIDAYRVKQPNQHSLSAWYWQCKAICTPWAYSWIRKEAELDQNYHVEGPNGFAQYIVQPADHVKSEYFEGLNQLSADQKQKLHSKIAATMDGSTEVKVTDDEDERKSSSSNDESDDPALQRLAILFVIMHEPVQLVTDIHRATVNCTCGETTRMLLPCRHVIAVNMKVKKQRFDANQIVPRWRRDYMINPTTKQPLKVKVQRWQPEDVQNEMRVVASNSNASVDDSTAEASRKKLIRCLLESE
jgi:hypothetical protein